MVDQITFNCNNCNAFCRLKFDKGSWLEERIKQKPKCVFMEPYKKWSEGL